MWCMRLFQLAAAAAAVSAVTAPAQSQGNEIASIAGTWLIAPAHYDMWVERGVEIAAYPVLRIHPDGKFTLYRLRALCEPDGADGKPYATDDVEKDIACAAARARSAKDRIAAAYARVSAAGTVKIEGQGKLRFISDERSPMPSEWVAIHRQMRAGGNFRDEATARRYEGFHSTFFVFDGREVAFERKGKSLILRDGELRESFEYLSARPDVLDAAMVMPMALRFSAIDYDFRCVVAKLEPAIPASGAPASALGKAAVMAREHARRWNEAMLIAALDKAGRATPAQRDTLRQLMPKIRQSDEDLGKLPLAKAIREAGAAKAFGCPEK